MLGLLIFNRKESCDVKVFAITTVLHQHYNRQKVSICIGQWALR